ncbi:MAG TPA: AMP-binding protein [Acidimicrobiales bacterium]|jgi:long-chain acyl-CoA synthetase
MAGPDTVTRRFLATVEAHGDVTALLDPFDEARQWTFTRFADDVATVAAGLAERGVRRGDRVVLMMRNRAEFHLADTAALFLGATPFSVYNTASPDEVAHAVGVAGATLAIVEDAGFVDRFDVARQRVPALETIAVADDSWTDLRSHGRVDLEELATASQPDEIVTIIFTSGTTGPAKAVQISHANVCATSDAVVERSGLDLAGKRVISYLPMAHIAERVVSHYSHLLHGLSVTPCPDIQLFRDFAVAVRPNVMFGVPRVWEKLQQAVLAAASADPARAKALDDGIAAARELVLAERAGTLTKEQQDTWDFLDAVAFSVVRDLTGLSELVLGASGAAPISPELIDWFRAMRIPLSEVYGMSESTGVISWEPYEVRPGTVGKVIPQVEVRIADDGEILARGPNVFPGYLGAPGPTAEILEGGWLHTGDIGELDDDGFLRIVDRKKELIITAGGENVSPANLEAALATLPLVGQACVVGDGQKFPAAIVTLDPDYAPQWAAEHGRHGATFADLADDEEVRAEIQHGIEDVNRRFTRSYQVKKFVVVPDIWLPSSDLLTPTFKLKRRGIAARYAAEIAAMYA